MERHGGVEDARERAIRVFALKQSRIARQRVKTRCQLHAGYKIDDAQKSISKIYSPPEKRSTV